MSNCKTVNKKSINQPKIWQTFSIAAVLISLAQPAAACVMAPPLPPPNIWIDFHGDTDNNGKQEFWIGQEVSLFPPTSPTNCKCGLGLGNLTNPLSGMVNVLGVMITKTNILTHISEVLQPFTPLQPNSNVATQLANDPRANPGATWFGFGGLINAFNPPVLGLNEVIKLWFEVETPKPQLLNGLQIQFAGGSDDPSHEIEFFAPINDTISVPEPSVTLSIVGLAGLMLLGHRRSKSLVIKSSK
ncbi:hypothetical protein H6G54_05845 [Anabaena cylindrica FACHB-243]|nr:MULTISPECIES: hypothetical protein [Anabaena]MBD2417240.1 hypothetical protein [Anabaena cylindrica FACHB-243]MBY5282324.1 hypothetical protein [Anabaena sp. CCAP 1446/1C]MBY5309750.1 hypothetical protein [Anabaena sp. CCAP 1446/1C]MCM2404944.1 hypothetical protein [Anabaena sp. CCAP 1446/1C]